MVEKKWRYCILTLPLLFFTVFLHFHCKREPIPDQQKVVVTFVTGRVLIYRTGTEPRPARLLDKLTEGDIIETARKAFMIVQVNQEILIRVESNTTLKISELIHKKVSRFFLKEGTVISKIVKLEKGENYFIRTPTVTAAVRGTEFSIQYQERKCVIATLKGKVSVRIKKLSLEQIKDEMEKELTVDEGETKEIIVPKGKKAISTPSKKEAVVKALTPEDSLAIQRLSSVSILPEPEKKAPADLEEFREEVMKQENIYQKEIKKLIKEKPKTLEQIKKAIHRIDEIYLYNGSVIRGAIISKGNKFKILTTSGIKNIPKDDIKQIKIIK